MQHAKRALTAFCACSWFACVQAAELIAAAKEGDLETLQELLQAGAVDVNATAGEVRHQRCSAHAESTSSRCMRAHATHSGAAQMPKLFTSSHCM
jgi:hypothetical protein